MFISNTMLSDGESVDNYYIDVSPTLSATGRLGVATNSSGSKIAVSCRDNGAGSAVGINIMDRSGNTYSTSTLTPTEANAVRMRQLVMTSDGTNLVALSTTQAVFYVYVNGVKQAGIAPSGTLGSGTRDADVRDDGNELIIGHTDTGSYGTVWCYTRAGTTWTQRGTLTKPAALASHFGAGVAISSANMVNWGSTGDGVCVVGWPGNKQAVVYWGGAGSWAQQAILSPPETVSVSGTGSFGSKVDVSYNGDLIAVSYPLGNKVYIYKRSGGTNISGTVVWTHVYTATPSTHIPTSNFGACIRFSSSGNTLAIGSPDSTVGGVANKGAVFLFHRSSAGSWFPGRVLTSEQSTSPAQTTHFGDSIDIKNDNSIVIGEEYTYDGTAGRPKAHVIDLTSI